MTQIRESISNLRSIFYPLDMLKAIRILDILFF